MMHPRRHFLRVALGLCAAGLSPHALAALPANSTPLVWRQRALLGFGTTLWLKAAHANADLLETALDEAVAAIRDVEKQMSLFDPHSALSRLNARGQLHKPDPDLLAVLNRAREVSAHSDGAFDVSMQPLWQLWSRAGTQGALPSPRAIARARSHVNWRAVEASPAMVRLNQPRMALSLNGIAQGHASDRVKAILQSHGIAHALIDTGETSLLGHAQDGTAWSFGIEDAAHRSTEPSPVLAFDGRAIATSSDAHSAFSADHRHHHIMDPRTGYSPTHWSSVTVLADSCAKADALTKVFFMLPPAAIRPAARHWAVDVVLQDKAGHWMSTLQQQPVS
jgi:thiamine biosynthesis lipoprotein